MTNDRIAILLESLGIDEGSFDELLEWVLCEKLVRELSRDEEVEVLLGDEAELRRNVELAQALPPDPAESDPSYYDESDLTDPSDAFPNTIETTTPWGDTAPLGVRGSGGRRSS